MKVLVVGGYGIFGGRIVELLENEPRLTLTVGGRSLAKAEAFCRSRGHAVAQLAPTRFDRNGDLIALAKAATSLFQSIGRHDMVAYAKVN